MQLELDYFDDTLLNTEKGMNILVLGDKKSGKSTLIKTIVKKMNKIFKNGNVCTDSNHYNNVYSEFLDIENIYKRYSTLISKRCFINNYYLILDDYYYSKNSYNEVFSKIKSVNMNLVIGIGRLTDFKDYCYIFICRFTNKKELEKVYKYYIDKLNIFNELQDFINFVNLTTTDYDTVVINVLTTIKEKIFTFYNSIE